MRLSCLIALSCVAIAGAAAAQEADYYRPAGGGPAAKAQGVNIIGRDTVTGQPCMVGRTTSCGLTSSLGDPGSLDALYDTSVAFSGFTNMPVDATTYTAGRSFQAECTVGGNVKVTASDASQRTVPLNVGLTILPYAVTAWTLSGVTGPATCTYANLK